MSFIVNRIASPTVRKDVRQSALDRIYSDPGIPDPERTTASFWLKSPHPVVSKHQSPTLPSRTDYVIIGTGITATSVARTLLKKSQSAEGNPSLVMVEARDTCSGATGRNGGHIMETVYEYAEFKEHYGQQAAMEITKFRLAHLQELQSLVAEYPEGPEYTQTRKVTFVGAFFDQEAFNAQIQNLKEFKKDMPEASKDFHFFEAPEAREKFSLSQHAVGAITGPAGAAWPYRLVTMVLADLLEQFPDTFSLETGTPITRIDVTTDSESYPYTVTTPRGVIRAKNIVHCTNGHAAHLIPGLRGRVFPLRGQMSAQGAGERFGSRGLENSWLLMYEDGFDYLTQLPEDGSLCNGEMMFGGGLASIPNSGLSEIGVSNDDCLDLHADIHLSGALSAVFDHRHWGPSTGMHQMWTGIMGFSADGFPWVGALPSELTQRPQPESGSEWAAVAFGGEGMVNAWLSGKTLAFKMMAQAGLVSQADLEKLDPAMPVQYEISKERIERTLIPQEMD